MKNDITEYIDGPEFRKRLLEGVDLANRVVGSTMGVFGRNNLIERKVHEVPIATNDGKRAIKALRPKDPVQNFAVRVISNAAENTDLKTGDGTSGTVVLAHAIIHEAFKRVGDLKYQEMGMKSGRVSVVQLKKEINEAKDKVLKKLEKSKKLIKSLEDLEKVSITSVEDEELGKIIAKMVKKIGENGFVFVEEAFNFKTETEVIEGMKFGGKIGANFMITNRNRMEMNLSKSKVIVTNQTVKSMGDFIRAGKGTIFGDIQNTKEQHCILLAWKFERKFLLEVADMYRNAGFMIYCVKVPSILTEQLKDIALYVGAKLSDEHEDHKLQDLHLENLGTVERLTANAQETVLVGGAGKKSEINKRIKEIQDQIKIEKIPEFKPRLKQRIADLSSGIGVIRIGHDSQLEQLYVLDKVQDAVLSTKEALKDGVVKGGGLALKEINLDNILTEPIKAPYQRIQENAGKEFEIPDDVVDPFNVVKVSLENAVSVASTLITCGGAIVDVPDWTLDDLASEIRKLADKIGENENPIPIDPEGPGER